MNINHSHLPNWLEKAWVFRKLFLIRKLFLTRNRFKHYGQMGEDIILKRFFPKRHQGFFVDVGCFHPIKYNNTYYFYRKGWRGINIDIDKIKIEGFNLVRPKDTNIQCAVSDQTGELSYWSNGFYTPTITMDRSFTEVREGKKYEYVEKKTKADTLTNIIDGTKYKGRPIDLLSIDVEGHDFQVLKSLDFDRYAPQVIAVETQLEGLEAIQKEPQFEFLLDKGYAFRNWVGMTLVFVKKDLS